MKHKFASLKTDSGSLTINLNNLQSVYQYGKVIEIRYFNSPNATKYIYDSEVLAKQAYVNLTNMIYD